MTPSPSTPNDRAESVLVFGLGITGIAVLRALVARGLGAVAVDDRPSDAARATAGELGLALHEAPSADELGVLLGEATALHPTPGLPESHAVFALANAANIPVVSEFDLAQRWDDRPLVAVTGTDGKTSVCTMATQMLVASGVRATMCGNTDVPLIEAIEDPTVDVFVVEASSFRLAQSQDFRPTVGTWLNYGPDHLDVHNDLSVYENSKAKVFAPPEGGGGVVVANADDPVVMKHFSESLKSVAGSSVAPHAVTFGRRTAATYAVVDDVLVGPGGPLVRVDELWRSYPHDIENVLAAAASVMPVGATREGIRSAAMGFVGLPHRVDTIAVIGDVRFVNDSKATVPHATLSAIESFTADTAQSSASSRIVLLAGGKNKGLDLSPLAEATPSLRGVVAIGDAAAEVSKVFAGGPDGDPDDDGDGVPVTAAATMSEAVARAASMALPGDVVLLSPACASFDWYRSYGERGDDFIACVESLAAAETSAPSPPSPTEDQPS